MPSDNEKPPPSDNKKSPTGPYVTDDGLKMIFPTQPNGATAGELLAAKEKELQEEISNGDRTPSGTDILQLEAAPSEKAEEKEGGAPTIQLELEEAAPPGRASAWESSGTQMTQKEKEDLLDDSKEEEKEEMMTCSKCGITLPAEVFYDHTCRSTCELKRAKPKSSDDYDMSDELARANERCLRREVERNG